MIQKKSFFFSHSQFGYFYAKYSISPIPNRTNYIHIPDFIAETLGMRLILVIYSQVDDR